MEKNLPATQEIWVQSLGWEDSLEKGMVESQTGIKIARRNINNLRYTDDTTLMAGSEGKSAGRAPPGLGQAGLGQGSGEPVQGVGTGAPEQRQLPSSCFNAFWFPFSTAGFYQRHSDSWAPSLRRRPDHTPLHGAHRLRGSDCHFAMVLTSPLPHNPQWNILDKPTVSKVGTTGATLTRVL